jgi:hypothetical protein
VEVPEQLVGPVDQVHLHAHDRILAGGTAAGVSEASGVPGIAPLPTLPGSRKALLARRPRHKEVRLAMRAVRHRITDRTPHVDDLLCSKRGRMSVAQPAV